MAQKTIEILPDPLYIRIRFTQQPNIEELASILKSTIVNPAVVSNDVNLKLMLDFSLLDDLDFSKTLLMRVLGAIIHHHGIRNVTFVMPKQEGLDPAASWQASWDRIAEHTSKPPVCNFVY